MEQTPSTGPGHPYPSQQGMPGGPPMVNGNTMQPESMQGPPMNNFPPHNAPQNMGDPGMSLPMGAPRNAMSLDMVPGPSSNNMMAQLQSEGSPDNAPAAPGQRGPSSSPAGSTHDTAIPTPNTINSGITQSPAPNGTHFVPPASSPASQPQQLTSTNFMSADFMQSMSALDELDPMFRTDFEQDFREWFDPSGVESMR